MSEPVPAQAVPKPMADVLVSPSGRRDKLPRDHTVSVQIAFNRTEPKYGEFDWVDSAARAALALCAAAGVEATVREVRVAARPGKDGKPTTVATGIEAAVVSAGCPSNETIAAVRSSLIEAGYRVLVREHRLCHEVGCMSDAEVEWGRRDAAPQSWYSSLLCGKHNYRACSTCNTVFRLRSSNATGPAPSLHCSVCGVVMVEWGGSKVWDAEVLTLGTTRPAAD